MEDFEPKHGTGSPIAHWEGFGLVCYAQDEIIGPCFFCQQTVDKQVYKSMLRYCGLIHIAQLPVSPIFKQDVVSGYICNATRECLFSNLEAKGLINGHYKLSSEVSRPKPLDFFLWWHVKDKVYAKQIQYLQHLKIKLLEEFEVVMPKLYQKCRKTFALE